MVRISGFIIQVHFSFAAQLEKTKKKIYFTTEPSKHLTITYLLLANQQNKIFGAYSTIKEDPELKKVTHSFSEPYYDLSMINQNNFNKPKGVEARWIGLDQLYDSLNKAMQDKNYDNIIVKSREGVPTVIHNKFAETVAEEIKNTEGFFFFSSMQSKGLQH